MNYRDRIKGLARLPGERIEAAPLNPRTHDEKQRGALRGLLTELGVIAAGVVWVPDKAARAKLKKVDSAEAFARWLASFEGTVQLVDGHLRREELAAQDVPVIVTDLDAQEAKLALATFDPVGELAGRDLDRLRTLLGGVEAKEAGTVDLLAGLRRLLPASAPPDDEEEPVNPTDALVKKWSTAPGQLWVVPSLTVPGREHRLLCGDCRDPANVERLRAGRRPKLGLHDPPYGIAVVSLQMGRVRHGRNKRPEGAVSGVQRGGKAHKRVFAPVVGDEHPFDPSHLVETAEVVVLWGANNYANRLPPSAEWVVWLKLADDAEEADFSSAELAWVSPPRGRTGHVRRVVATPPKGNSLDGEQRLHPTQKPIKGQRAPIQWYTEPGDDVEDWYMGAGAVIIACELTGRIGHGMDIAHAYLAATLERLSVRGLTPRLV